MTVKSIAKIVVAALVMRVEVLERHTGHRSIVRVAEAENQPLRLASQTEDDDSWSCCRNPAPNATQYALHSGVDVIGTEQVKLYKELYMLERARRESAEASLSSQISRAGSTMQIMGDSSSGIWHERSLWIGMILGVLVATVWSSVKGC